MDIKDIESSLYSLRTIKIDKNRKEESIQLLMERAHGDGIKPRPGFFYKMIRQLNYIDQWVFICQLAMLMIGLWLVLLHTNSLSETQITVLSIALFGALLSVVNLYESYKSYQYKMWELEAACRYSLSEVILQRYILTGGISIGAMLVLAAVTSVKISESIFKMAGIYMLPLMLVCIIYLKCLKFSQRRFKSHAVISAATAAVLTVLTGSIIVLRFIQESGIEETMLYWILGAGFLATAVLYVKSVAELGKLGEEELQWEI